MKKNAMKTMVATVCVVAAGMGGIKAYNAGNQSEVNMLLAENIEALSRGDGTIHIDCLPDDGFTCWLQRDHIVIPRQKNNW